MQIDDGLNIDYEAMIRNDLNDVEANAEAEIYDDEEDCDEEIRDI